MAVTYELAVHLRGAVATRALKRETAMHGLKHPTLAAGKAAAKEIVKHPDVEYVNVSRVSCESKCIIRA